MWRRSPSALWREQWRSRRPIRLWYGSALALLAAGLCSACGGSTRSDKLEPAGAGTGGASTGTVSGAGGAEAASSGSPETAGAGNGAGIDNSLSFPCLDEPCAVDGPRPLPLPRPHCPDTEPKAGQTCEMADLYCGYGNSAAASCRRAYRCTSSSSGATWVADETIDKTRPCVEPTVAACPANPAPRTRCSDAASYGASCQYPGLVCSCWQSAKGNGPGWACLGAPANLACPEHLPNVGEGCTPSGIECDYALDGCDQVPNSTLFCNEGAWENGQALACLI